MADPILKTHARWLHRRHLRRMPHLPPLKPPASRADARIMKPAHKAHEARPWGYSAGHAWRYDVETIPSSMEVRFHAIDEAVAAGFCGCECGVCRPEHSHSVEDGCVCSLFGCFCYDKPA